MHIRVKRQLVFEREHAVLIAALSDIFTQVLLHLRYADLECVLKSLFRWNVLQKGVQKFSEAIAFSALYQIMYECPTFSVKNAPRVVAGLQQLKIADLKKRVERRQLILREQLQVPLQRQAKFYFLIFFDRKRRVIFRQTLVKPGRNL